MRGEVALQKQISVDAIGRRGGRDGREEFAVRLDLLQNRRLLWDRMCANEPELEWRAVRRANACERDPGMLGAVESAFGLAAAVAYWHPIDVRESIADLEGLLLRACVPCVCCYQALQPRTAAWDNAGQDELHSTRCPRRTIRGASATARCFRLHAHRARDAQACLAAREAASLAAGNGVGERRSVIVVEQTDGFPPPRAQPQRSLARGISLQLGRERRRVLAERVGAVQSIDDIAHGQEAREGGGAAPVDFGDVQLLAASDRPLLQVAAKRFARARLALALPENILQEEAEPRHPAGRGVPPRTSSSARTRSHGLASDMVTGPRKYF